MPLVQPKGIYCFYSRELLRELRALIGGRDCLEMGAGDGTLARFLADEGVRIRVIGSRYRFASGNWNSYESQDGFEWGVDGRLSSLVLPPELESVVLVFRRKPTN